MGSMQSSSIHEQISARQKKIQPRLKPTELDLRGTFMAIEHRTIKKNIYIFFNDEPLNVFLLKETRNGVRLANVLCSKKLNLHET